MTRSDRLAVALAVLAVLAVLGSAALTVSAYTSRDRAAQRRAPEADRSGAPAPGNAADRQEIRAAGGGAVVEVPSARAGWTRQHRNTTLYYLDRRGRPSVGVTGAAVYRAGYCRGRAASNRAFVGFTRSVRDGVVDEVNADLGRRWVRAIALGEDLATSGAHTPLRTQALTLADGTPAVRSTSRITTPGRGTCAAPSVELALVSLDAGDSVATVVLVRDSRAPGTLPAAAADEILASLHRPAG